MPRFEQPKDGASPVTALKGQTPNVPVTFADQIQTDQDVDGNNDQGSVNARDKRVSDEILAQVDTLEHLTRDLQIVDAENAWTDFTDTSKVALTVVRGLHTAPTGNETYAATAEITGRADPTANPTTFEVIARIADGEDLADYRVYEDEGGHWQGNVWTPTGVTTTGFRYFRVHGWGDDHTTTYKVQKLTTAHERTRYTGIVDGELRELSALPDIDDFDLSDIVDVDGETYILRAAAGTNTFAGVKAGAHDHLSATTNSHAGAVPIYGQFTSDPDNAVAGVIAHTIGQLQILIKKSSYEAAKGSAIASGDQITALISAGSPSRTDTITLSRLASHDYSDDGVDYVVFQYADNDGDLNFWRQPDNTAWTMRVFEGTGTTTPLLVHADNLKHWVLYHFEDETRLDAEVVGLDRDKASVVPDVESRANNTDVLVDTRIQVPSTRPSSGFARTGLIITNLPDGKVWVRSVRSTGETRSILTTKAALLALTPTAVPGQAYNRHGHIDMHPVTPGSALQTGVGRADDDELLFYAPSAGDQGNPGNFYALTVLSEHNWPKYFVHPEHLELSTGVGLEQVGNRVQMANPDVPVSFWGKDVTDTLRPMRAKEVRVDDQRAGGVQGYHFRFDGGWHADHDVDRGATSPNARLLSIGDQVRMLPYSSGLDGYDGSRPGFTWESGHQHLSYNGAAWTIDTAGTTTRYIDMVMRIALGGVTGDSWSIILTASDNSWFGSGKEKRITFTVPAGYETGGTYDWVHTERLAPNAQPSAGSNISIQIRLNSSQRGLRNEYVYDSDITWRLPEVDHVPKVIKDVGAPVDSLAFGGRKVLVPPDTTDARNFLKIATLGDATHGFADETNRAEAALIVVRSNNDEPAIPTLADATGLNDNQWELATSGAHTRVWAMLVRLKKDLNPALYQVAYADNHEASIVGSSADWTHLGSDTNFDYYYFYYGAAQSIAAGAKMQVRAGIGIYVPGVITFTHDLRNCLMNLYSTAEPTKTDYTLELWTWIDGLVPPHRVRQFDHVRRGQYYISVDFLPIKAGQHFALVATGTDIPTLRSQMGNPRIELDTNIDERFPQTSVLIPGLIRDTNVYSETILASRNISEITLQRKPLDVAHKDSLIAIYVAIRGADGNGKLAGTIMLQSARALADSNNYAIAGHWGSGQDETMRWDPDDNKVILSGGPVSVAINDVIEAWVEHYL